MFGTPMGQYIYITESYVSILLTPLRESYFRLKMNCDMEFTDIKLSTWMNFNFAVFVWIKNIYLDMTPDVKQWKIAF